MNNLREKLERAFCLLLSEKERPAADTARGLIDECLAMLPAEPFAVVTESEFNKALDAGDHTVLNMLALKLKASQPEPRRRYVYYREEETEIKICFDKPLEQYTEILVNGEWVREGRNA